MVHMGEVNRPESGSAKRSAGNEIGGSGPRIDSHEVLHVGKVNRSESRSAKKSAGSEIGASGSMIEVVIEEPILNELHEVDKNVVGFGLNHEFSATQVVTYAKASTLTVSNIAIVQPETIVGPKRGRWKRLTSEGMVFHMGANQVDEVLSWAHLFLQDFHAANAKVVCPQQLPSRSMKWRPPEFGAMKLNSDAAFNSSNNLVSFGLVVNDHLSRVQGSSWQIVEATFSPQVVEALVILQGIVFASALGVRLGVFESYVAAVVSLINANFMARGLAKLVLISSYDYSLVDEFPPHMKLCVLTDLSG
ncbi:hypothetical protein ACOSQ3_012286 [Xanthoceras sorbifolium]